MPTDTFVGVDAPLTCGRVYGPALPYEMRMQRLTNKLMNWSAYEYALQSWKETRR